MEARISLTFTSGETVEKGIGGWLSPWQMRRTGRARIDVQRKERLALAQAEQDIESIRSGRKRFTADYQLVDGPAPNDETAPRGEMASRTLAGAAQRVLLEQMRAAARGECGQGAVECRD